MIIPGSICAILSVCLMWLCVCLDVVFICVDIAGHLTDGLLGPSSKSLVLRWVLVRASRGSRHG